MRKTIVLIVAAVALLGGAYLALNTPSSQTAPPSDVPSDVSFPVADAEVVAAGDGTVYEVVSGESHGRYLVREQLAGIALPVDAVGVTTALAGRVGLSSSGAVLDGSQIVVNLASLTSDQSRRDQYVRTNILRTQQYPNAIFVPREVHGIPTPMPTGGTVDITIIGDLTIRDVTRPVVWEGTATFATDGFHVSVRTAFDFAEFGLTKPRVAAVLSVDDQIRLEASVKLRPV